VNEAIFFGYACGIAEGMRVGDCVIPTQVQTLDGVTTKLGAEKYTLPHAEMTGMISEVLQRNSFPFRSGKSVSVPATFWHGDESQIDSDVIALELEFAAFCYCANAIGIKAAGIFIITDTREQGLLDKELPRDPRMIEAFRAIREHLEG
jgi:purine-nucleoside phosphorylase